MFQNFVENIHAPWTVNLTSWYIKCPIYSVQFLLATGFSRAVSNRWVKKSLSYPVFNTFQHFTCQNYTIHWIAFSLFSIIVPRGWHFLWLSPPQVNPDLNQNVDCFTCQPILNEVDEDVTVSIFFSYQLPLVQEQAGMNFILFWLHYHKSLVKKICYAQICCVFLSQFGSAESQGWARDRVPSLSSHTVSLI